MKEVPPEVRIARLFDKSLDARNMKMSRAPQQVQHRDHVETGRGVGVFGVIQRRHRQFRRSQCSKIRTDIFIKGAANPSWNARMSRLNRPVLRRCE